jgi:hypothetical protein
VFLALLFVLGVWLRLQHMDDILQRTTDENVYTYQANRILNGGLGQFPVMVREYNQDPRLWLYPSPLRAGWDVPLAFTMKLTGVRDERAGSWLACFLSVLSLGILGMVAARFLPPEAALYGMLFMACSVPDLTIARRCWQDALMGLLGALMVWCACEITRMPGRWWPYAVFILAGSYSVLVKELGAFVYLGCVAYVLLFLYRRQDWRTIGLLAAGGLAGAAFSTLALIFVAGGYTPMLAVWRNLNQATATNPYCIQYQGGPWYLSIEGLWILSPIHLLLWAAGAVLLLLPVRYWKAFSLSFSSLEISSYRLFSWMAAMLLATILLLPNSQSFRFLAPVYGPMYFVGGIGLWTLVRMAARKLSGTSLQLVQGAALVLALVGAFAQYEQFVRAYVTGPTLDLSIKYVLDSRLIQ